VENLKSFQRSMRMADAISDMKKLKIISEAEEEDDFGDDMYSLPRRTRNQLASGGSNKPTISDANFFTQNPNRTQQRAEDPVQFQDEVAESVQPVRKRKFKIQGKKSPQDAQP